MTFDADRTHVVMFGGSAPAFANDTWEWDGTDWSLLTSAVSPRARRGHALVYDSARRETVLFGGRAGAGFLADTWTLRTPAFRALLLGIASMPPDTASPSPLGLTFSASAGGSALLGDGAAAELWNSSTATWEPIASNAASSAKPASLDGWLRLTGPGPYLIRVRPAGPSAPGGAALSATALQVVTRYQLP